MARVQMKQKNRAPSEVIELYSKIEKNGAMVLNLYKVLAHNPDVMRNFLRLGSSLITRTKLSPKLRELVILRIAKLTGSGYEWAQHYPIALEAGVSREQAEAISQWSDSPNFNDQERAVLQYTDEVEQRVEVKEDTFRALQRHLNEQSIVELTLSIGYWGMVARFLVPLRIDIDVKPVSSAHELTGRKD